MGFACKATSFAGAGLPKPMPWAEILLVLLLVLLNGFLVLAELSIVSSRSIRLQRMAAEGRSGAHQALELNSDSASFLPSVQIGITVVAILTGAYGERALSPSLADLIRGGAIWQGYEDFIASALTVVVISYVSLVIGELAPKRLALEDREKIACVVAPVMHRLAVAATPLAVVLRWSTTAVLRAVKRRIPEEDDPTEDIKLLIAEGTERGAFVKGERDIIERVLAVADRSVRAIMVPRTDIVWLDIASSPDEILRQIAQSGHSRFPLRRGAVDESIGIVHTKTLLEQMRALGRIDLESAATTPLYVHESAEVVDLIEMLKQAPIHMAVVLDEHGSVEGIVTPADILAGFAGELREDIEADDASFKQLGDGAWLFDAQVPVFEAERVLSAQGLAGEDEAYTTLAGFILSELGHIPAVGETVRWNGWQFEVAGLDRRRISKVIARPERGTARSYL